MPTRTIRITAATFALQDRLTTEYVTSARDKLPVQSAESEVFLRAIVDIPPGEVLLSASLEMNLRDLFSGSSTISVQRINPPQGAYSGLNWNNRPANASGSSAVSVTQSGASTTYWTWNVTADVTGRRVIDWRVSTTSTTRRYFRGTRAENGWPRLVITTGEASSPPDGLTPDGGAVSLAAPTFQWNERGDATGFRLQIDEAGGDFSTPLKDTGNVTSDDAAYTLAGFSLVNGTAYDWRVAHVLPSGLSDWSDPASISRATKSSLTLGTINAADPTPPVTWTFGGTQTQWQVFAKQDGKTIANSGQRAGTDTAWTPPTGPKASGAVVTYYVRVWDGVDRAGSPNDPDFTEASSTITYTPTATVAPMTSLTIAQVGDTPAVLVTAARTSGTPDDVVISRDGQWQTSLPATDLPWTSWLAAPNTEQTYRIRAVVNGSASSGVVEATFRTAVTGAWLVDTEDDRWFSLSGHELSMSYGSSVQTFTPLTAAKQIRRTSSLRGLEGEIGGQIVAVGGKSVADQVADLWAMRSTPHRAFRLILGDLNIPVTCSDLWAAFDPETSRTSRIDKTARFTFAQTGDELPFEPV